MSRDYKRSGRRKGRASAANRQNGWLWLAGGLVLGAMLGYLGYLLQAGTAQPTADPPAAATPIEPPAPPKPQVKPAAAERSEPAPAKNRFEFYTLLPEMEMQISDERFKEALKEPPKKTEDGPYILQVGSFRRMEEADSLKARLAFLGIEAKIQTVVIRDDDIWYRVRVGPYDSLRDLGQARTRLQRNDIDFMVLRIGT